jgi:hypothetical protein
VASDVLAGVRKLENENRGLKGAGELLKRATGFSGQSSFAWRPRWHRFLPNISAVCAPSARDLGLSAAPSELFAPWGDNLQDRWVRKLSKTAR